VERYNQIKPRPALRGARFTASHVRQPQDNLKDMGFVCTIDEFRFQELYWFFRHTFTASRGFECNAPNVSWTLRCGTVTVFIMIV
jgi:ligand-binding SRPBCC domain-containing protein